jgi:hypothetical protein
MSDAKTPVGSMDRRVSSQPGRPGYIRWKFSAVVRDSFAR